ncbi:MAG: ABC transporter substrate-binding protein, partial [Angelakisella sp.]
GAELESGTTATHNKIAASAYKVGICLDYVSRNLAKDGALIGFAYPTENLVSITSPIALVKNCANADNGKLLYDYILSKEGQEILVANNLTTVRGDVTGGKGLSIDEIAKRSMKVDDVYLAEHSAEILESFDKIFK